MKRTVYHLEHPARGEHRRGAFRTYELEAGEHAPRTADEIALFERLVVLGIAKEGPAPKADKAEEEE